MQKLHVVGYSEEEGTLILAARRGVKSGSYFLAVDDSLLEQLAAVRRGGAEVEPEAPVPVRRVGSSSLLSPREIQARLRAGRTIEEVAREAQVGVDWVERFAAPVLAEQAAAVERAGRAVLHTPRKGPSDRPLEASVRRNLAERGVLMAEGEFQDAWSARHLMDTDWLVSFRFRNRGRAMTAEWMLNVANGALSTHNRLGADLGYIEPGQRLKGAAAPSDATESPTADGPVRRRAPAGKAPARQPPAGKSPARPAATGQAPARKAPVRPAPPRGAPVTAPAPKASPTKATARKAPSANTGPKTAARSVAPAKAATPKAAGLERVPAPTPKQPAARSAKGKVTAVPREAPARVAAAPREAPASSVSLPVPIPAEPSPPVGAHFARRPRAAAPPVQAQRPVRALRPLRAESPERAGRPLRAESPERAGRPLRAESPERAGRPLRAERPARPPDSTEPPRLPLDGLDDPPDTGGIRFGNPD